MPEIPSKNIHIKKVLNTFEAATNVESGKQNIVLLFSKKYKIKNEVIENKRTISLESFSDAKRAIEEKLRKGYVLQQASIDLKRFADEVCYINFIRENGFYKIEEDLEFSNPEECTVTCSYDKVCKAISKTLNKKF